MENEIQVTLGQQAGLALVVGALVIMGIATATLLIGGAIALAKRHKDG